MSRAFVNEDTQEELPVVPERAPLPAGSVNYVTPTGMEQLLAERARD
jgi:transcription elongation factor GreB